jgi:HAD superfamily hydrolase (TIGR01509 family)
VFADAFGTLESARTARLPVAVVSASPRSRLDLTLATAGLSFAVTVSGDEVAAGKPAPDGYLEAARRLGVEPADCVVVEDSIPGVLAAVAAGARVVAVERSGREGLRAALADAGARVVGEVTAAKLGL